MIVDVSRKPASEHRLTDNDETQDKDQRLQRLSARPLDATVGAPQEEERRHDERAGGVAEPPCQPDRRVVAPTRKPAEGKARDSKRGAHGGADDPGQKSEFENVLRAIKRPGTVGEPSDQVCAQYCLKGISHRDSNGGTDGASGGHVDQKCAEENTRPDAIAAHEKSSQRQSGGRPHGSRAGMHNR